MVQKSRVGSSGKDNRLSPKAQKAFNDMTAYETRAPRDCHGSSSEERARVGVELAWRGHARIRFHKEYLSPSPCSSRSALIISRTSSGKLVLGDHPSLFRALAASPTNRSTSVG